MYEITDDKNKIPKWNRERGIEIRGCGVIRDTNLTLERGDKEETRFPFS